LQVTKDASGLLPTEARAVIATLLNTIENSGVRYCVLHGWRSLPEYLPSDLDIVVHPQDFGTLEKHLCQESGTQLAQVFQHESSCYYFVLANRNGDKIHFLPIDTASDYRRDGFIFFSPGELLVNHEKWKGLSVAAPAVEFAYSIVKRISKGSLSHDQKRRLHELRMALGEKAESIARHLFGPRLGKQVSLWLERSNCGRFEAHCFILRRALRWQIIKRDPLNPIRYWFAEVMRIVRRCRYPTGLFVVVLGPDGAGKSTLIDELQATLAKAFRGTAVFHFRPNVFRRRQKKDAAADPHGQSPYSPGLSLLKLSYYILDYCTGYLLKLLPRLVRSTLILFDRYYDDLLVDSRRYRYGGSRSAIHVGHRFVPSPDLFLILDAPEDQLLARKREVGQEELQRQRKRYRELAAELPNAILLDGSLPPKDVAGNASRVVVDHLHNRYLKRRHLWFGHKQSQLRSSYI
jgi:thymidylate kinase